MARHSRTCPYSVLLLVVVVVASVLVGFPVVLGAQSSTSSMGTAPLSTPGAATFLVAPAISTSSSPSGVAVGDLRGNGTHDLVVANSTAGTITVFLGKGSGLFAAGVDYAVGKNPTAVTLVDLTSDGKLDVVVCNRADGTLSILAGNGDGTFGTAVTAKTIASPIYVAAGDFNGDGKTDLAVAGTASQSIAIHLNDGTGGVANFTPYQIGKSPSSLVVADLGGSNHADIATANSDGTMSVLLGRGDGTFRSMSTIVAGKAPLSAITSGDFNHDGKIDLAVTQTGTKLVQIFFGNGTGTFRTGSSLTVGTDPASILLVDVNGDGVADLITANQSGNTFSVLLGNGDGTFQPSLDFVAGKAPSALAAGDFNGDGKIDLAIANFGDKSVSVPLGNGDGTFKAPRAYSAELQRKAVAVGDVDGDGKLDLVVTNFCGSDASCSSNGTATVFLANGDGTYRPAGNYALGAGPLAVALADVNGDKKLDLIAANKGDKTVTVLLGNGDASFQSAFTLSLAASPAALAVGDFNGDGKVDLAIATDCGASLCPQSGQVSILLGTGDGSFQSAAGLAVGFSPVSIAVGDVNGDGKQDLVVANACGHDATCKSKGSATVLLGDGKGGFQSQSEIALGKTPSSVVLGDLSRRKVLDLVTAHSGDNKIAVSQGNGDASFKNPVPYSVGTAPSSVVIADFNGDGKPDVAVANQKDSTISVFFGVGDGTLGQPVVYPAGAGPESLAAVDARGIGRADLVAANGDSGQSPMGSDVMVLSNLGLNGPLPVPVFSNLTASQIITYGTPTITLSGTLSDPLGPTYPLINGTVNITIGSATGTATITDNVGNFSGAFNTSTIPASTTPYVITYDFAGDTNVGPATDTSTALTVNSVTVTASVTANNKPYDGTTTATTACTVNGVLAQDAGNVNCAAANANFATANVGTGITVTAIGITLSGAAAGNYTLSSTTATTAADITPAIPAFSGLTASQTITFGTPSVTLSGVISAAGPTYPPTTDTVTITINGLPKPAAIGLNGTFSIAFPTQTIPPSGTPYVITYSYNNPITDNNFASATDTSKTLTVNKATPTVAVSSIPNPSNYGQPVTFTATVAGINGATQPTGNVDFKDGVIVMCANVPLTPNGTTNSKATCSYNALTGGPHANITVVYNPGLDPNYQANTSSPMTPPQVVNPVTPAVVVASNPTTSTYGQTVTFTVTLTGPGGGVTQPTGTAVVFDGAVQICTTSSLAPNGTTNSSATCQFIGLSVGPHANITAVYIPGTDPNYLPATSPATTQTVTKATPTVAVSSTPSTSTYGQQVVFTATVAGVNGVIQPTGTVDFLDNGLLICSAQGLTPNGTINSAATCISNAANNNLLSVGVHTNITAVYKPLTDPNYLTSASPAMTPNQTVNTATPTVIVTSSPNPSTFGQQVTFTATLAGVNGATQPTGTVDFKDGSIVMCTGRVLAPNGTTNSVATCQYSALTGGPHASITATYVPGSDLNYLANSAGMTPPQVVNKFSPTFAPTQLQLTLGSNPSIYGQPLTILATLTGVAGQVQPSGNVTFTDTYNGVSTVLCTSPLAANGTTNSTASCAITTPPLAGGGHSIVASFNSDTNYSAANSAAFIQQVNQALPTVTVSGNPNPSVYGGQVVFTAIVTGVTGDALPTGTVSFSDGGTVITSCNAATLVLGTTNSSATCTTSLQNSNLLGGGTHGSIQAKYIPGADPNYLTATSPAYSQTVNTFTPTVGVSSNNNPSTYGQQIVFTATVTGVSGDALPTGTVSFFDAGQQIATCKTVPLTAATTNSIATCATNALNQNLLSAGTHSNIQAVYNADTNYGMASFTFTQVVKKFVPVPGLVLTQGPNPSVYTQSLVFTATITGVPAGTTPSGMVTFTDALSNQVLSGCSNLTLVGGAISCPALPVAGNYSIVASYSGDSNYGANASPALPQTVQNFTYSGSPLSGSVVTVAQGYDTSTGQTTSNPFSPLWQPISITATPIATLPPFADTLVLKCQVTPAAGQSGQNLPTCIMVPPTGQSSVTCSASSCTFTGGHGLANVTLAASTTTPIGLYQVTITATDKSVSTLFQTVTYNANVISQAQAVNVLPGATTGNSTAPPDVLFAGPANATVTVTFPAQPCQLVAGSGLGVTIPTGGGSPTIVPISCSISQTTLQLKGTSTAGGTGTLTVTIITGSTQSGALGRSTGILAAAWLAMPGIFLLGSLRGNRLRSSTVLRFLGMSLIVVALLVGLGCGGGGFTRQPPPSQATPTGAYSLLVQGADSNGVIYSAIVPVNVGH